MASNSKLYLPPSPSDSAVSKSKKAGMKKDIILMLEEKELGWNHWSVSSEGENFVNILTECLWCLDGHHSTLKDRCIEIPSAFQHLQGYNKPEASKHRRKDATNLDASKLDAYSSSLNKLLLQPWFDTKRWTGMRQSTTMLAEYMTKYAAYLKAKCDTVKKHHATLTPVRSASDCESFCLIPKATWVEQLTASKYRSLQKHLDVAKEFEPLLLNEYAPINTR